MRSRASVDLFVRPSNVRSHKLNIMHGCTTTYHLETNFVCNYGNQRTTWSMICRDDVDNIMAIAHSRCSATRSRPHSARASPTRRLGPAATRVSSLSSARDSTGWCCGVATSSSPSFVAQTRKNRLSLTNLFFN